MGITDAMEPPKPSTTMPPPPADTQRTCIDLPGERARCYLYKSKLQIVLRKHRDVIFDIDLGIGSTYTVEADQSDFYNARDKKLVEFKRKQKATFKDGERLHLWVSRKFKGHLLLKSDGKVLGRYEPNVIDRNQYDDDPKTKPAPLIVVMNVNPATNKTGSTPQANAKPRVCTPSNPEGLSAEELMRKPLYEQRLYALNSRRSTPTQRAVPEPPKDAQDVHIVEVKDPHGPGVPQQVGDFFKKGGEETAIDSNGVMTRNWLWSQIAGATAYYADNYKWINELWNQKFYIQKVVHKTAGTRWYIVFKGLPGLRDYITSARYGVLNPKVIAISSGAGSLSGVGHAAWDAAKGSLKKAGAVAVFFTIALDTAEWLGDYEQRDPKTGKPKKDFFDLAVKVGVDLAKAGLSAALGTIAMGVLVLAGVVTGGAVVVVGAIVLSVAFGFALDWLDKKTGATDRAAQAARDTHQYLEKKLPADYAGYADAMGSDNLMFYGP